MMSYKWVNNQLKLNRAMDKVGPDASEQELKAEYVRIGGKLNMDEVKPEEIKEVVSEEAVVEPTEEVKEIVEESPKVESSESGDGSEVKSVEETVVTTDDVV